MDIRLGKTSDTKKISQTHKSSIQTLCKDHYSPENIKNWTSVLNPEIYKNAIKEKILIVAEENYVICGFGIIDIDSSEICAVYIHPEYAGKGIAKSILSKLESFALEKDINRLNTCSTINARGFYKHCGYIETEKRFHQLPNNTRIECVKMYKKLKNL